MVVVSGVTVTSPRNFNAESLVSTTIGLRLTGELTEQALRMALITRQPTAGLLHHSERGSQYAIEQEAKNYTEIVVVQYYGMACCGCVFSETRRLACWIRSS